MDNIKNIIMVLKETLKLYNTPITSVIGITAISTFIISFSQKI